METLKVIGLIVLGLIILVLVGWSIFLIVKKTDWEKARKRAKKYSFSVTTGILMITAVGYTIHAIITEQHAVYSLSWIWAAYFMLLFLKSLQHLSLRKVADRKKYTKNVIYNFSSLGIPIFWSILWYIVTQGGV